MSDTTAAETAPLASGPTIAKKTVKKKKAAGPRKKSTCPGLGERLLKIVGEPNDRKGKSLCTITKALAEGGVDVVKQKSHIKLSTKRSVAKGFLVQAKGYFKLAKNPVKAKVGKKAKPAAAKKPAAKKTTAKKVTAKKSPAKKVTGKKAAARKAATPKKAAKKAAPKKKTPAKALKKTKSLKAAKPVTKPSKPKAKAKVTKKSAKK
ncbi:histone H1.10-like [Stegostoma tigrinum]|uniref:histone H1.10-like n=1 Tax=Stegostoma tigrinum TaxID=3053191 RepID=UPI00202B0B0F|nr:histone H1.10-like [Stegostoma tigrinum]